VKLQSHVLPPLYPPAPPPHHYRCHNHLQKQFEEERKKERRKEGGFINGFIVTDGQKNFTGCSLFAISKFILCIFLPTFDFKDGTHIETFLLPTDAHNVKKHRVIKTF